MTQVEGLLLTVVDYRKEICDILSYFFNRYGLSYFTLNF